MKFIHVRVFFPIEGLFSAKGFQIGLLIEEMVERGRPRRLVHVRRRRRWPKSLLREEERRRNPVGEVYNNRRRG
jgi:hypothetical protein